MNCRVGLAPWGMAVLFVLGCAVSLAAASPSAPAASSSPTPAPFPVVPGPSPAGADFPPWRDPLVDRLGWLLTEAVEELGAPAEVSVLRGTEPRLDAVVFYYRDSSYLYWWGNRLWQVRFDRRYRGEVLGVEMGMTRAEVLKRLGDPRVSNRDDVIYQLPDRGFPVRLRLIFAAGRLDDLYLYRADF